jgi:hypothetical protein
MDSVRLLMEPVVPYPDFKITLYCYRTDFIIILHYTLLILYYYPIYTILSTFLGACAVYGQCTATAGACRAAGNIPPEQ